MIVVVLPDIVTVVVVVAVEVSLAAAVEVEVVLFADMLVHSIAVVS